MDHDHAAEAELATLRGEGPQSIEIIQPLPQAGQRMNVCFAAGEQHATPQVQRFEPLRGPLVADSTGDVGVLSRRTNHRADTWRGQRDVTAMLDRTEGLDRDDVFPPADAGARLEVGDQRVQAM